MRKPRMNKIEKILYKALLARIESGEGLSYKARLHFLKLHLNKTY